MTIWKDHRGDPITAAEWMARLQDRGRDGEGTRQRDIMTDDPKVPDVPTRIPSKAPRVPIPAPDTLPQCAGRCYWIWVLPNVLKCLRCGRIKTGDR